MSIKDSLILNLNRGSLKVQKHSPEILLGAGLIGGIVAAVMAAKATLRTQHITNIFHASISAIQYQEDQGKDSSGDSYSHEDATKEKASVYVQTGLQFAKLYGPSVGLGVLSISAILASHGIMANRQVALVGAYNLVVEGFKSYRQRVVDELGEDVDRNYHLGLKDEVRTETETTVAEDGTTKKNKVKKTSKVSISKQHSMYSRFFDEHNPMFRSDRMLNKAFLQAQQSYMNDILIIRGHVFLNEVYEALGFDHTKEGAIVGWVLKDPKAMKDEHRDGYIDFGIYDIGDEPGHEFVNLTNPTILLDFNVDGIVFDQI